MRHKTTTHTRHSLRTLIIFCGVVFFLIGISLLVKTVQVIKTSQFDNEHRFTLAFVHNKKLDLVSIEPASKRITHLNIESQSSLDDTKRTVGVFTDSTVVLEQPFSIDKGIASYMRDGILKKGADTTLSLFDLLRLSFLAQRVSKNDVISETITLPAEKIHIDQVTQELFLDKALSDENSAIEIVNGTGIAGLGGRLERALVTMGANVIAVSNAEKKQQKSLIIYYGEKTYTVERLEKLLKMPIQKKEGRGLSDIIIIVGQDKENTISY